MAARKFLYVVAILVVLTLGSAAAYRLWGQQMLGAMLVPKAAFSDPATLTAESYADKSMWYARPDIMQDNPATWLPAGTKATPPGPAAVFFIHPTSYMDSFNLARWNAPLDNVESGEAVRRFVMTQASAFSEAGQVRAPRYHQAHFGAFLAQNDNSIKAINAAYRDVVAAFRAFLTANPAGPMILAGHSQGSLHLLRLMKEEVAAKAVADRIVAAYVIGWPVSMTADIPALGLAACERPGQAGCILSWQSFAEPADTSSVSTAYGWYTGMTGQKREGTAMLCVNPLTGTQNATASPTANTGTLVPAASADGTEMRVLAGAVGARCGAGKEAGFLMIGAPPQLGPYVLPGNNYHVYDYALFWSNIRADATRRLTTFLQQPH